MTRKSKAQVYGRIQLYDGDAPKGLPITVVGREWWALEQLIKAGDKGCTPIDNPAPRWAHYVWLMRGNGIDVETIHETHGGPFPGSHARYVLRTKLSIVEEVGSLAA
ncbi:hypothetical protein HFO28_07965 [Rhizobium leguminosarum]|uniref:winged helix domain-containing protein n=1 Tax=Rhizobium leguminosarum TaxID=384 RepID=UPI001C93FD3D|nr:hypothetical protein [Rhizobium leguminosarum]MBY5743528.1 hypothetical protein [Rhizobium leguminosarum]